MSFELSAASARVARPRFLSTVPKFDGPASFSLDVAQPASMDDSASSDSAEPKWRGLDMILSLACGGLRHCVEFRCPLEKLVECVGDDLLCRPAIHRAGE